MDEKLYRAIKSDGTEEWLTFEEAMRRFGFGATYPARLLTEAEGRKVPPKTPDEA